MFFVRGTGGDSRTTVCTAHAANAVTHHAKMIRLGLTPVITDQAGRELSLAELRRRARPLVSRDLQ